MKPTEWKKKSNKTNSNLKPNDKTKTIERYNTAKWKWNEKKSQTLKNDT